MPQNEGSLVVTCKIMKTSDRNDLFEATACTTAGTATAGVRGGGDEGGKTPGKKKRRLGGGVAIRDAVGSPTGMLH